MSQVIQAACPGCHRVLTIPADWLQQVFRCKHCGMVIQARPKTAPVPTPPPVAVIPVAPRVAVPAAAPPANGSGPQIATPVAAPVQSALAFTDQEAPIIRTRYRRRSSVGKWIGLVFFLLIVGGAAAAVYRFWPQVSQLAENLNITPEEPAPPKSTVGGAVPTTATEKEFPRRALAICVSNYLYANPVSYGSSEKNLHSLLERMSYVLHISPSQIAELSDAAQVRGPKEPSSKTHGKGAPVKRLPTIDSAPRPPLKPVIEQTITEFLSTCRPQDCILLLFLGHVKLIDDEGYLVPLEGEMGNKNTLIPLQWLYGKLKECKARQKVLILDTCRIDPGRGEERPGSGPMPAKLDEFLTKPPSGVQIWSSCVADQYSYELDGNSIFLDKVAEALQGEARNANPKPRDLMPIEAMAGVVNVHTTTDVDGELRAKQTPRLAGAPPRADAPYEAPDAPAPRIEIATAPAFPGGTADKKEIVNILKEIEIPSIKLLREETPPIQMEALLPFSAKTMEPYRADYISLDAVRNNPEKYPLRVAILDAVKVLNKTFDRSRASFVLMDSFAGASSDKIKKDIEKQQRGPARVEAELRAELDKLLQAKKDNGKEPSKRWQAHFDYIHAQLFARIVYVTEYNSMLAKIRKDELPMLEGGGAPSGGWRMVSRAKVASGKAEQTMAKKSRELLEKLAKEHAGTPWEILAKREQLTSLGLEWQAAR
jgi:hypothetical protein